MPARRQIGPHDFSEFLKRRPLRLVELVREEQALRSGDIPAVAAVESNPHRRAFTQFLGRQRFDLRTRRLAIGCRLETADTLARAGNDSAGGVLKHCKYVSGG